MQGLKYTQTKNTKENTFQKYQSISFESWLHWNDISSLITKWNQAELENTKWANLIREHFLQCASWMAGGLKEEDLVPVINSYGDSANDLLM